ncbi:hypothetical protein TSUD_351950 [Trifolium subterraneum]|nr:hypothetical protein TSUD_351950 [Trifolium subterraneum]
MELVREVSLWNVVLLLEMAMVGRWCGGFAKYVDVELNIDFIGVVNVIKADKKRSNRGTLKLQDVEVNIDSIAIVNRHIRQWAARGIPWCEEY